MATCLFSPASAGLLLPRGGPKDTATFNVQSLPQDTAGAVAPGVKDRNLAHNTFPIAVPLELAAATVNNCPPCCSQSCAA